MIPNWKIYPRSQGHSTVYLQEFCAAGNGAVFPDDQPVVVALRIVIKHLIALKVARVPDKVVIGRHFRHLSGPRGLLCLRDGPGGLRAV